MALILGQALALMAGTLLYYQPVTKAPIGALDRIWLVGVIMGVAAAMWTAVLVRLVLKGCEAGFASVRQQLREEIDRKSRHLMATRDAVIFGMAKLSESRDAQTGQHLLRIRRYVELLARQLRETVPSLRDLFTDEWIADLGLSSALHDIGKVGVPDSVLLKPGKLTPAEFDQIKRHTSIGGDCLFEIEQRLSDSNFLMLAREIAYAHHEWWNGDGYPLGLQGTNIPLSARIVALADVYDALTTNRPYKPALAHSEVVKIIRNRHGTHFEPAVVDAFMAVEPEFDRMRQELASEESPRVHADAA
ncbi:MAG: HD domain-containing protein [Phycisphaerales bacterium]|nr:HD domain-containing protein [Phycisphaerales bacterium]MCI0676473.1 HD domain-containing protein [Phycisphaerales bacterium]